MPYVPDPGPLMKGPRRIREWANKIRALALCAQPLPGIGTSTHPSHRGTAINADSMTGGGWTHPFKAYTKGEGNQKQVKIGTGILIDGFVDPMDDANHKTIENIEAWTNTDDEGEIYLKVEFNAGFTFDEASIIADKDPGDDLINFGEDGITLLTAFVPLCKLWVDGDDLPRIRQLCMNHLRIDWCVYNGKAARYPFPF